MLTRTTTHILDQLRDPNNAEMWQLFDARFRPVIIAFARKRGLGQDEAAEVAQVVLAQFTADYQAGRYDRSRGRLSSWIIGIASHRIADVGRAHQRASIERGESAIVNMSADRASDGDWQEAIQKVILERAMNVLMNDTRMDARTIRAFELCAVRNVPAEAAATECDMTVAEVYVAKNRAIKKLRDIVAELTEEFDDA